MAEAKLPCPTMLRLALRYEPETGRLFWRKWPKFLGKQNKPAGKQALNCPTVYGYLQGGVFKKVVITHRVIWALVYGYWPKQVDHINGVRNDNRIVNLREVDDAENRRNHRMRHDNKSGFNGVHQFGSKWRAEIGLNWKRKHLGVFNTLEEAIAARAAANEKYGFHVNHGLPTDLRC